MQEVLMLEKIGNVAVLTLNRPEVLNAINMDMRKGLADYFKGFAEDDDIRAVVLTGAGRAFSSGGDIKGWKDADGGKRIETIMDFAVSTIKGIASLEKPVIAMVNGDAFGAASNLAFACDLVIASENARFGELFVRFGLGPDWGGAYILPRLIGMMKTKELLFTGKIISAREALDMGLISRIVPQDELKDEVMQFAETLANSATRAIGMTKIFLNKIWRMDLNEALEYEKFMQAELMKTDDHQNAVEAFWNKEKPVFKGK